MVKVPIMVGVFDAIRTMTRSFWTGEALSRLPPNHPWSPAPGAEKFKP
jgi:hypothetical protein